jgi:hypothetical protein
VLVGNGRPELDQSLLTIDALTEADVPALSAFRCGDDDLDDFIKNDALRLDEQSVLRTYLARYGGIIVGYVSLLADAIVLKPNERKKLSLTFHDHPIVPALKVARLGVEGTFRNGLRGAGESLMRFAFAQGVSLANSVGCRLLTVDAYSSAVAFYKDKLGFRPNLDVTYMEPPRKTVSMRLDLFAKEMPAWVNPPYLRTPQRF